jgi:hypothetical protein
MIEKKLLPLLPTLFDGFCLSCQKKFRNAHISDVDPLIKKIISDRLLERQKV